MIIKSEPNNEQLRDAVDRLLKDAIDKSQFLGLSFIAVGGHGQ